MQYGLLEDWTADPGRAPQAAPDLAGVRAVLDGVTPKLLDALTAAASVRTNATCPAQLQAADQRLADAKALDALHRRALDRALRSVCA